MIRLACLALLALASCGADGAPQPPVVTGMTMTGSAEVGVIKQGN